MAALLIAVLKSSVKDADYEVKENPDNSATYFLEMVDTSSDHADFVLCEIIGIVVFSESVIARERTGRLLSFCTQGWS